MIISLLLALIPAIISLILMDSCLPAFIIVVFLFMLGLEAAEDRKYQMVYIAPIVVCIISGIVLLLFNLRCYYFGFSPDRLFMMLAVFAIIIFACTKSMGAGDILIYIGLFLYNFLIVQKVFGMVSLLTLMFSLALFIIRHLPKIKKQRTLHIVSGYTTDIYIACWFITILSVMFVGAD